MKGFAELHQARAAELTRRLEACADVKSTTDCACAWVDTVRQAYASQEGIDRAAVNALCCVARAAVMTVGSVSGASARVLPARLPDVNKTRFQAVFPYIPAAVTLALAVWLYLSGDTNPAFLSLAAAALSVVGVQETRIKRADVPQVEAQPTADAAELTRRLGYLFQEMDATIASLNDDAPGAGLTLSRGMLESLQMLMEAKLTEDGDFALRSIPRLADALARQGVEMALYTPEQAKEFDLLPAQAGGETIRPALIQGDKVLMRGQATVKR